MQTTATTIQTHHEPCRGAWIFMENFFNGKLSNFNTKSRPIESKIMNLLFKHKPKTIFRLNQTWIVLEWQRNYNVTSDAYFIMCVLCFFF